MKKRRRIHALKQAISSIFMIIALVWLTISIPFVYTAKQKALAEKSQQAERSDNTKSSNPFGNNTDEKAPSGATSFSEEYLHHTEELFHAAELFQSYHVTHAVAEYQAFHGELLCPPPNHVS